MDFGVRHGGNRQAKQTRFHPNVEMVVLLAMIGKRRFEFQAPDE